jgi:hypothetical protein
VFLKGGGTVVAKKVYLTEREKGKRDSSLKSMVKSREEFNYLSDDSPFS